jgi:cell division protein FtsN
MARTFSRPIFKRKSRLRLSGILGGALLLLSLGALVAGVFGALYLDHFSAVPAIQAAQPAGSTGPARPFAVAQAVVARAVEATPSPSRESPPAGPPPLPAELGISTGAASPTVDAASGSSEPPVVAQAPSPPPPLAAPEEHHAKAIAMLPLPVAPAAAPPPPRPIVSPPPSPAASPPAKAAPPPPPKAGDVYWVEYGAYATTHYAKRLRQSLAKLGLDTSLSYVPGRGGRHYYRVRSAAMPDRAAAQAAVAKAEKALNIAPLLHHEHRRPSEPSAVAAVPAKSPHQPPRAVHDPHYWVQFGAFAVHGNAERLTARLRDHGIAASISPRRRASGRTLYFVRCSPLPDQASAGTVAKEAQAFLGTAVLIGQSARHGSS